MLGSNRTSSPHLRCHLLQEAHSLFSRGGQCCFPALYSPDHSGPPSPQLWAVCLMGLVTSTLVGFQGCGSVGPVLPQQDLV